MTAALLTTEQHRASRLTLLRTAFMHASWDDLTAERAERANHAARYAANLEASDFSEGDAEQLRGGIAYEAHHVRQIDVELARRARAMAVGYREGDAEPDANYAARFADARRVDSADVFRALTGEAGKAVGDRVYFTCPIHPNDDHPSLVTYPVERGWHCFGCGAGGDAVALIAAIQHSTMLEALVLLESGALGVGGAV